MPIVQPQPYIEFGQWLDANAEELARAAGTANQQEIKAALREIAKATGQDWDVMTKILVALSSNKLLPLFIRNLSSFSEIAKIALRHTENAFYAFNAAALSELMKKNPEALRQIFSDVIGAASKSALPAAVDSALFALSNDNIAALAVDKPELLISIFNQIAEDAGKFSPYVFSAISDRNISTIFARNPEIILNTYAQVAAISNREAAAIFLLAIKRQKLFEIFMKSPEKVVKTFIDPAKACGKNADALFYLLNTKRIAYMLEMNPQSLIVSLNAFVDTAGEGAEATIPLLFDERVQDKFFLDAVELGASFNYLVKAAGDGASRAITLLRCGGLLPKFLESPEAVIHVFSSITEKSGDHVNAAFDFLASPHIANMLEKDPDRMIQILSALSASCGESTPVVFGFLAREGVAARFEQDPDGIVDFFSMMGKAASEGKKGVFDMFVNARFVKGFEEWPEETMENLRKIADSAGPYAGDVFMLLSKDELTKAITQLVSGKHLAICLSNLVNNSGKDAPMVLRLFENDEFTQRFVADPYREEQIVNYLRSFVGNDLIKGLQVIGEPEIQAVFSEDPSVLVTTRFRTFINEATAKPDITAFEAMEAILKDTNVKKLFIQYVKQEFHGGDSKLLENELIPALVAYKHNAIS